ncbi:MAG: outer membrane beta-barrel protein [Candidatus Marinimicrobia bacterium]|nr:outer membrane beta-barrel protein [Candidatus Neomarinimicrobiota bacterium]
MRKCFVLLVVFGIVIQVHCISAESPLDKGVYGIGGNVAMDAGYINIGDENYNITAVTFRPDFFYFILPRFAVGSTIVYDWTKMYDQPEYVGKYWGLGPHIRYYYLNKAFKPYVFIDYWYGYHKDRTGSNESTSRSNSLNFGTGIDFFLVKNVALEPSLAYYSYHSDDNFRSRGLEFSIGVNVFIY